MICDVFISYSSNNEEQAFEIKEILEKEQLRCWLAPVEIRTGENFLRMIPQAVRDSGVLVVVLTEQAQKSPWVQRELVTAVQYHKPIFALKIDESDLTVETDFVLKTEQICFALTPPLEKWISEMIPDIREGLEGKRNSRCYKELLLNRIPYPRETFVGREKELAELEKAFSEGSRLVVLSGMGGIGKSEIARQYAARHRKQYETIVFAECLSTLEDTFADDQRFAVEGFCRRKDASGQQESNHAYSRRKLDMIRKISGKSMLIILDNYDNPASGESLHEWADGGYHLLVTSRCDFTDQGCRQIQVERMKDPQQLKALFEFFYGRPVQEEEKFRELLELVGGHTMMVELLAKQMRRSHKTFDRMGQILREGKLHSAIREKITLDGKKMDTIYGFICALFDMQKVSAPQQSLLRCLSLLPPGGMEFELFGNLCGLEDYDELNDLIRMSWAREDLFEGTVSLHPLIAAVVREEMGMDGVSWRFVEKLRDGLTPDTQKKTEEYQPYLEAARCARQYLPPEDPRTVEMEIAFGAALNRCSLLEESDRVLQQACRRAALLWKDSFPTDVRYAKAVLYLVRTCASRCDYEQALEWLEDIDAFRLEKKGGQGDILVRMYDLKAWCHMQRNRLQLAAAIMEELLAQIRAGEYPELQDAVRATVLNDYGVLLHRLGKFEESAEYLQRAFKTHRRLHGENSLRTAIDLNNLGAAYARAQNFERSLQYHKRSLQIRREVCGEKSTYTALQYDNVARAQISMFKKTHEPAYLKEAQKNAENSLSLHKELLGEIDQRVSRNYASLGLIACCRGDLERAESLFRKALEILTDPGQDRDERSIGTTYYYLGDCIEQQGRKQEAQELFRKSYEVRCRCLGEKHPDTLQSAERMHADT